MTTRAAVATEGGPALPFRVAAAVPSSELWQLVRRVWPALVGTVVVGVAFVALMPAGLPYDEPSHWLNVLYYLDHHRMPALGDPGTSYEAQMGPLAYVLDAVVAAPFRALGGDQLAFYAVRSLGIVLHLAVTLTLTAIAVRALPARTHAAPVVAVAVGVNPMLLAMATSIQNDELALLLVGLGILVIGDGRGSSLLPPAVAGALVGLAIITKATMSPVALALAILLLVRRRWLGTIVFAAATTLVAGWWFVRNLVLYGDLTAQSGMTAAGYSFPAWSGVSAADLAQNAITYLWLPTEYVRNTVHSPTPVDLLVLALTGAALVGVVLLAWTTRRNPVRMLTLAGVAALSIGSWAVVVVTTQALAFRTAYSALPFVFTAVGALAVLGRRWVLLVLGAAVLGIDVWFLIQLVPLAHVTLIHFR
ncbi:glycosyltransferase 87 family protein [Gryllotalpicola ginsengisoli]|uniref:glycosyltransferase 87 family protein n=1 Tax=Gryllotalpicola ginsengisoli TaxID=444608 RepID=UPI0003B78E2C|nr:glycosyltransferase 87 family protein [Gryllotalpicola ginsengisoli]